ncbi:MAG: glycine cleavage system protein GcvH [Gammaproteobacteria bacterium]|nr:glycine cleavage system protein GcvH [Gammaproteobacteria bacterium]NNJ72625.1 glycine cleavage system protein GcvH [Enterobacterales bacterium]
MSDIPSELKYSKEHEWVRIDDDGNAIVGITDHAQELLGDMVYVELPDVGTTVAIEDETGVVESVKAASDVYAPVSGEIIEVNESLADEPESINTDPYGTGWLYKISLLNETDVDEMLTPDEYADLIADE